VGAVRCAKTRRRQSRPVRAWAGVLRKSQTNFAGQPLVAPIKTNLAPELAPNHFFHDARAEPSVRGRLDERPACLGPAQTKPSVCREGPRDFNVTMLADEETTRLQTMSKNRVPASCFRPRRSPHSRMIQSVTQPS
jgi:hypothetical protein